MDLYDFHRIMENSLEEDFQKLIKFLPISKQSSLVSTNKNIEKSIENKIQELNNESWKYQIQPLPSL